MWRCRPRVGDVDRVWKPGPCGTFPSAGACPSVRAIGPSGLRSRELRADTPRPPAPPEPPEPPREEEEEGEEDDPG